MTRLSNWNDQPGRSIRVIAGGDANNINHRVAFIETTPRVRIRSGHYGTEVETDEQGNVHKARTWPEFLDWCEGPSGDAPTMRWLALGVIQCFAPLDTLSET